MFWVLDRMEGTYAVLVGDDKSVLQLPAIALPEGTREGDVMRLELAVDQEETAHRRAKIAEETEGLWK